MHSSVRVYREMNFWAPVCSQWCGNCCSEYCCSGCIHQSPGKCPSLDHHSTHYWMNSSVPSRALWKLCRRKRQVYFCSRTSGGYTFCLNHPLTITVYIVSFDNHPGSDVAAFFATLLVFFKKKRYFAHIIQCDPIEFSFHLPQGSMLAFMCTIYKIFQQL